MVFSCLECDRKREFQHFVLFLGVEPLLAQYAQQCEVLGIEYRYVAKCPGSDLQTQAGLFRALRDWKTDVILLHSGYAGLPACCLYRTLHRRTRLVYVEHTPNHQKGIVEWVGSGLAGWVADRVVYLTEASRVQVQSKVGVCFRPRRTRIIPNGIDADFFRPTGATTASRKILLGMQARMTRGKDHATLVNALAHLRSSKWFPQLKLQFAGTGETESELRRLVQELDLQDKVDFLGVLDELALRNFLWSLQIYVHSTKGETLSTAILQAQACGLPVVASKVEGVRSSIEHGVDGFLVTPGDAVALAETIEFLLENPAVSRGLAQAASERVDRDFTKELMWDSYATLCRGG